jgi:hypothetical protein
VDSALVSQQTYQVKVEQPGQRLRVAVQTLVVRQPVGFLVYHQISGTVVASGEIKSGLSCCEVTIQNPGEYLIIPLTPGCYTA